MRSSNADTNRVFEGWPRNKRGSCATAELEASRVRLSPAKESNSRQEVCSTKRRNPANPRAGGKSVMVWKFLTEAKPAAEIRAGVPDID